MNRFGERIRTSNKPRNIRENNLRILTEFMPISARFIANKASFKFKNAVITEMTERLSEVIGS